MLGISLEFDRAPVTSLGDQSASDRALAARRRVVRRDARNCLVRGNEIRYELLDFLRGAAEHCGSRGTDAENLEEVATLYGWQKLSLFPVLSSLSPRLDAHSTSSDTRRSHTARGT